MAPSSILGSLVAAATEDDVSLLWLTDQSRTSSAVVTHTAAEAEAGIVIYTGSHKKIAEHGGFAHDDANVMLLVANPRFSPATITTAVETAQIAPTILKAVGLDPRSLQAVRMEHTQLLPGLPF